MGGKCQVNFKNSERPGAAIHEQVDKSNIPNPNIEHRVCINSLTSLFNVKKIDGKQVFLDPTVLSNQLTVIAQLEDDVEKHFKFGMTPYSPSLFKDALMVSVTNLCQG